MTHTPPPDHPIHRLLSDPAVILVDSREQRPIPFPSSLIIENPLTHKPHTILLRTVRRALPAGDYALSGFETCCLIERKGSILELLKNFYDPIDALRQQAALTRLSSQCAHPILLLECPHSDLHNIPPSIRAGRSEAECHILMSCNLTRLLRCLLSLRIQLWMTGAFYSASSRIQLGSTVAAVLLESAIQRLLHPAVRPIQDTLQSEDSIPDADDDQRLDASLSHSNLMAQRKYQKKRAAAKKKRTTPKSSA